MAIKAPKKKQEQQGQRETEKGREREGEGVSVKRQNEYWRKVLKIKQIAVHEWESRLQREREREEGSEKERGRSGGRQTAHLLGKLGKKKQLLSHHKII